MQGSLETAHHKLSTRIRDTCDAHLPAERSITAVGRYGEVHYPLAHCCGWVAAAILRTI